MGIWGTRDMAISAKAIAEEAKAIGVATNQKLDNISSEWRANWAEVKSDLRREGDRRDTDQRQWREDLGRRLDVQDRQQDTQDKKLDSMTRTQWAAMSFLVVILLSIVGFFASHLPVFHGFT